MNKFINPILLSLLLVNCGGSAEEQSFAQATLSDVFMVLFALAVPIVLVLMQKLVQVTRDKWGIDISAAQEELVMNAVRQGLAFAEEQSRKAMKEGLPPKSGDEKKIEAVRFISEKLKTLGVLDWGSEKLADLVEAALHMKREDLNDPTPLEIPES